MSAEVRERLSAGSDLPVGSMKIPMVDLPLGATEDRVCGTIDIEKALTEGGCSRCPVTLTHDLPIVLCLTLRGLIVVLSLCIRLRSSGCPHARHVSC
jgi:hypothetical protein